MIIMEPNRRLQLLRPDDNSYIPELIQMVARNAFPSGSGAIIAANQLTLRTRAKDTAVYGSDA